MLLIDKYAHINKLKNFNPMAKFIFAIGTLNIAILINNIYINLLIFFVMVNLTTFVAKIPLNKYLKIFVIPFGFFVVSIITILISVSNTDIFIFSINIKNNYIGITYQSLKDAFYIIGRVLATISSTLFFGLTTPLNNIIRVLKKIKVPYLLIELLILIYRFIFIFLQEANEIYTIQEMKFGYIGFKNSCKSISLLIKHLFVRVLVKYEDMVIALDSKLFDGEFKIGD